MLPPSVLALHLHLLTSAIILVAGVLLLTFTGIAVVAARRDGGSFRLGFVGAAFGLFALKEFFTAWAVYTREIEHEELEALLAAFDLLIVGAFLVPFVIRK